MNTLFSMGGDLKPAPQADVPTPASEPKPKPKSNRKSQALSAKERLAWATKQLAAARATQRRAEASKAQIVGIAIIKAMSEDAAFKATAVTILKKHVTSQSSLIEIADLLDRA
jgi:hypothetical protein